MTNKARRVNIGPNPMSSEAPVSDLDELLNAFAEGSLLRPSGDGHSIVDLGRGLGVLAGVPDLQHTSGSRALADLVGVHDHLVLVIVDGLGKHLLKESSADSFLATHLATGLRTVFPSTTAVALTSVATGEWPNRHGVTGWWTHLTEIGEAATILRFARRSDARPLDGLGLLPAQALPVPSLLERIPRETLALFPHRLVDSVYSAYVAGGRERRGYSSLGDAINIIAERLAHANGPTYTYLYTNRIDSAAHQYGSGHPNVRAALHEADRQLEALFEKLDGRCRIVVTGDHGFVDVPRDRSHQIRASDPLMGLLRSPPSGDARVLYLHVRPGFEGRVAYSLRQRFGRRFLIIRTAQAEELELFGPGPLSEPARGRFGDLMVISRGADVIEYNPASGPSKARLMRAHHSGLTPDEMLVPLVIA
jgi:hypothetical protein